MNELILTFAILGNIFNFSYNVPFVWLVFKHWNADNISKKFLYIRILGSSSWIIYSVLTSELFVGLSYSISLISTLLITYVKLTQVKKPNMIENPPTNPPTNLLSTYV